MDSSLSRIEQKFIFNFLKMNNVSIEVKTVKHATQARILDFTNKEIRIELDDIFDEMNGYNTELKVFFYFQNNHHVFNTNIIKIQKNIALIRNPESVAKNLQRKHERVNVEDKYKASFEIDGEIYPLDYPKSKMAYFPEKAPVNADFSNVKIEDIMERFKNKLSKLISYNKIRMLRNYKPASFLEEMVIEYGKILYIPKSHSELKIKEVSTNLDILKKDDWIDFEIKKNGTNPTYINKAVSLHLLDLKKDNIFSQAIIPVLYRNYVVALIYLINKYDNPTPIEIELIEYASQFSRILSYSLKYNKYFSAEEGAKKIFEMPIYDISPGGLAFYGIDDSLEDKLLLDHNSKLSLSIEGRSILTMAKLVRKFRKLTKYFYGFMFLDIKNEDYNFINDKIYDSTAKR